MSLSLQRDIASTSPRVKNMQLPAARVASLNDTATVDALIEDMKRRLENREATLGPNHPAVCIAVRRTVVSTHVQRNCT